MSSGGTEWYNDTTWSNYTTDGVNPQRVAMEIMVKINETDYGQMASKVIINSHSMYIVHPLCHSFIIGK